MGSKFMRGVEQAVTDDIAAYIENPDNGAADFFRVDYRRDHPAAAPNIMQSSDAEAYGALAGSNRASAAPQRMTVQEAVDLISPDDDDAYDEQGIPTLAALSKAAGYGVTEEERDRVFRKKAPSSGARIIRKKATAPDPTTDGAKDI